MYIYIGSTPSLGRRTVCGRTEQRLPPVSKRYDTKVRMVCRSFFIAAAALKIHTRNAQGVNLTFLLYPFEQVDQWVEFAKNI